MLSNPNASKGTGRTNKLLPDKVAMDSDFERWIPLQPFFFVENPHMNCNQFKKVIHVDKGFYYKNIHKAKYIS